MVGLLFRGGMAPAFPRLWPTGFRCLLCAFACLWGGMTVSVSLALQQVLVGFHYYYFRFWDQVTYPSLPSFPANLASFLNVNNNNSVYLHYFSWFLLSPLRGCGNWGPERFKWLAVTRLVNAKGRIQTRLTGSTHPTTLVCEVTYGRCAKRMWYKISTASGESFVVFI